MINYRTMEIERAIGAGGAVGIDAERSRILAAYFLRIQDSSYPQYLQAFDLASQMPLGWIRLGTVNYFGAGSSPVQRLLRFGADGLIFTDSRGLLIFHTPLAGPAPELTAGGIRNALGEAVAEIRPGEMLTLSGDNLGPDPGREVSNTVDDKVTSLAGVQVWFNGVPGLLSSVSKNEVKVVAPAGLASGSPVRVQLWYFGIPSPRLLLLVR